MMRISHPVKEHSSRYMRSICLSLWFVVLSLVLWPSPGTAGDMFSGLGDFFSGTKSIVRVKAEFDLSPNDASALDWSPDGKRLAVSGILNPYVKVFDVHNKKLVMTLKKLAGGSHGLAYSPDGRFIAAGHSFTQMIKGVSVMIWDAKTGAIVKSITGPFPVDKPSNSVTYLAFSPDGRYLAVGYMGDFRHAGENIIYLYDTNTWLPLRSLGDARADVHGGLLFSPDGRHIAHGTLGGEIRIWDVASGQLVRAIKAHPDYYIYAISYSPNGKWIASCTQRGASTSDVDKLTGKPIPKKGEYQDVRIWDVENGSLVKRIGNYPWGIWTLKFNRSGSLLAIGTAEKQLQLWTTNGWHLVETVNVQDIPESVSFSPDNKYLAVGAGGIATVWEFKK